jgi:hypothetical protein
MANMDVILASFIAVYVAVMYQRTNFLKRCQIVIAGRYLDGRDMVRSIDQRSERFNIEEVDNINNNDQQLHRGGGYPRCMKLVFRNCNHVIVDTFGLGR